MQTQIIHYLKRSKGYLSGEEISRHVNISRAGIWKYMQELRKEGYEIEAVPHLGYQLVSSPDKLLAHEIQFELKTKIFGSKIFYYDTLTSTMDEAFKLGMDRALEGTVVCSETQTKGRGRMGRSWSSPKYKGIYLSIILRPQMALAELPKLTLLTAVVVAEAIQKIADLRIQIKWPNDLLIERKKVAGILTELRAEADQMKFVVVGIGLNVNTLSHQLIEGATSLRMATGKNLSRVELVQEILRIFERRYFQVSKDGFDRVLQDWKQQSQTLGQRVKVLDPSGSVEGIAFDLAPDGGLMIRKDSGVIVKKLAGDVRLMSS